MKRIVPLLFVLAVVLIAVPNAEASHCERCKFAQPSTECVVAVHFGWTECFINEEGLCQNGGVQCTHGFAEAPLASSYTVASVERLDQPKAAQTQIASTDAPQQPTAEH